MAREQSLQQAQIQLEHNQNLLIESTEIILKQAQLLTKEVGRFEKNNQETEKEIVRKRKRERQTLQN